MSEASTGSESAKERGDERGTKTQPTPSRKQRRSTYNKDRLSVTDL